MLLRFLSPRWLPVWMRRDHPIVQRYIRQPFTQNINPVIFGTTFVLFVLFGGLGLPLLYLLFSLVMLVQLAVGTVGKIYDERERFTWDLIRVTPFSRREMLLCTWAASVWQMNSTWLMPFYRVTQGMVIVGLLVLGLWLGHIPAHLSLAFLVGSTLLITLQPVVDIYFGGMVGLLAANVVRERMGAQMAAITAVMLYWGMWIALVSALVFSDLNDLTSLHLGAIFGLCLLLPLTLGYGALRLAEMTIR